MSTPAETGTLYVVATPIGNLEDLTELHTLRVLGEVDVVCCEDTRHTGQLLAHEQITTKRLLSLHEHNEASRIEQLLDELGSGKDVTLVSDAGTPLVSIRVLGSSPRLPAHGFTVQAVPGASAVLAALTVSGFDVERFSFEGFLPRKGKERNEQLIAIAREDVPVVLYESPQRIDATLADLVEHCGAKRLVAICRELTKLHEETWRGPLGGARSSPAATAGRGEYALVLDAAAVAVSEGPDLGAVFARLREAGLRGRDAVTAVEVLLGVPHRAAYAASIATSGEGAAEMPPPR